MSKTLENWSIEPYGDKIRFAGLVEGKEFHVIPSEVLFESPQGPKIIADREIYYLGRKLSDEPKTMSVIDEDADLRLIVDQGSNDLQTAYVQIHDRRKNKVINLGEFVLKDGQVKFHYA